MTILERRIPLRTQKEIDDAAAPLWLGWIFIASAVFYGLLLGHAVLWLIRWAV